MKHWLPLASLMALTACSGPQSPNGNAGSNVSAEQSFNQKLWRGGDLSYVNELDDCGAVYSDDDGRSDAYQIMAAAGANLARLRLWHSPDWTDYSTLSDVRRSITRAKYANMQVLLDFHYSDTWADPGAQIVPKAWRGSKSEEELAQRLYDYTYGTLMSLAKDNLLPEFVQIGNETNSELLMKEKAVEGAAINWARNVKFLNAGIKATRDVSSSLGIDIGIMLHVAQPENVEPWFDDAIKAGLSEYDILGVSYYPKWSEVEFSEVEKYIKSFREKYSKEVVIVETAYPWTMEGNDEAKNILREDALIDGYEASRSDQKRQLIDLMQAAVNGGGLGVVYWEPAWISSDCETRSVRGSRWENAALFDFEGRLHGGADFLSREYSKVK